MPRNVEDFIVERIGRLEVDLCVALSKNDELEEKVAEFEKRASEHKKDGNDGD